MPPNVESITAHITLKRFHIFKSSLKKLVSVFSLPVAPQVMLIPKKCAQIASKRCQEMPPKKTMNKGIQVKFSRRDAKKPISPRRYRMTARQTLENILKTTIKETKTAKHQHQ